MSIPDTIGYLSKNLNVYYRISEFEKDIHFSEMPKGIWLDCFKHDWYDQRIVENLLGKYKTICFVSPELHNRSHIKTWEIIKKNQC